VSAALAAANEAYYANKDTKPPETDGLLSQISGMLASIPSTITGMQDSLLTGLINIPSTITGLSGDLLTGLTNILPTSNNLTLGFSKIGSMLTDEMGGVLNTTKSPMDDVASTISKSNSDMFNELTRFYMTANMQSPDDLYGPTTTPPPTVIAVEKTQEPEIGPTSIRAGFDNIIKDVQNSIPSMDNIMGTVETTLSDTMSKIADSTGSSTVTMDSVRITMIEVRDLIKSQNLLLADLVDQTTTSIRVQKDIRSNSF